MMRRWRALAREESGQSMVLMAILLLGMLGVMGLVVDGGRLMDERRLAQNAADAAAWAGAFRVQNGGASAARADALASAAQHGYPNDGVENTVEVHAPPASGQYQGNGDYVQVVIRHRADLSFIQLLYSGAPDVSASATAGKEPAVGRYAIVSLETNCSVTGLGTNGNNDRLKAVRGGIMVNSCSPTAAMWTTGNGAYATITGDPINVVGGWGGPPGAYSETPRQVPAPIPDPLGGFHQPTSTMGLTNFGPKDFSSTTVATLSPGIYDHISIKGQAEITLNPGVYIIKGGDFEFAGQGSLTGHGVTIFMVGSHFPTNSGTYGSLKLTGNGSIDLTAPTSGDYAGVVIDQQTDGHIATAQIAGNGSATKLEGSIHMPKTDVTITGNGALTTFKAQFIARTIRGGGNANLVVDLDPDKARKVPVPALVE